MRKVAKEPSLKLFHRVLGVFLVVSVLAFVGVGVSIEYQDLNETYALGRETAAFIEAECQKYDNYMRGNSASSLENLVDKAEGLDAFIAPEKLADSDFLHDFIVTEHVSGIIVLDADLAPVAQADMDGKDAYALWKETISKGVVGDILLHPQRTYVDHVTIDGTPYDMAVIASANASRLILCYASTEKPAYDPYELTLKSVLANNSFYKDPTLLITDGTQALSTNNALVDGLEPSQYRQIAGSVDWKDNQLTEFSYQGVKYYGLRHVYGSYKIYVVYEEGSVFTHQTAYIAFALMAYLAVGIVILVVQRRFDKASIVKMEKQLQTINAISAAYSSTFLLHMDTMELEPIHPSERLGAIYREHPEPYDFLFVVCKTLMDEELYAAAMHFMDLGTVAARLKGKRSLTFEARDRNGAWFSVVLIPQKLDEAGDIEALLVTTRDITSVKQSEELSFKDKLTGLYNRNYMESHGGDFADPANLPVSLIMADCNYLKCVNDSLGHEYGDLLLQRVANSIVEATPPDGAAMRIGGDEFLIVCPHCDRSEAARIVEAVKRKLSEHSDEILSPSASFGISTTESGEFSLERAFEEADRAMYCDKRENHAGR